MALAPKRSDISARIHIPASPSSVSDPIARTLHCGREVSDRTQGHRGAPVGGHSNCSHFWLGGGEQPILGSMESVKCVIKNRKWGQWLKGSNLSAQRTPCTIWLRDFRTQPTL